MTSLRAGKATSVGQVRPTNQDNLLVDEDRQLFAVADGMGGHRGGETASEVAVEALIANYTGDEPSNLGAAVKKANEAVVQTAAADPSLKGMGTTMCAMSLVAEPGTDGESSSEERLLVANVGDSRLYLLKAATAEVQQITEDHSLVATLERQGQLTKAEAAVHPHRNILTRALGIDTSVLVDMWELRPVPGDRYLICSDGLFNEVDEATLARLLRETADPDQAARKLVELADENGGRDNITVVVVDVLGNGTESPTDPAVDRVLRAERADEQPLVVTGMDRSGRPVAAPPPPPPGATTSRQPSVAAAASPVGPEVSVGGSAGVAVATQPSAPGAPPPPGFAPAAANRTKFTWRLVLFFVVFLAVIAGAFLAVNYFATNTYYVGFEGENVVVFQGRPGGVLWIKPTVAERTTITRSQVPADAVDELTKGKDEPTIDEARAYLTRLQQQIEQQRGLAGAAADALDDPLAVPPDQRSTDDTNSPGTTPVSPP
jgi:protein phosphatase